MADALELVSAALADRYRIDVLPNGQPHLLGQGGMATVYLAHDLKHDRSVAIKLIRPGLASELGTDRFLREIALVARLNHPHILALHDSGEAGGLLYYVMPHETGGTLRDQIQREGPLPVAEVLRVGREVALALDYAHAQGIVHRDIKPSNILFSNQIALVADFGIARAMTREPADTISGFVLGTPAYMSPEQAVGDVIDGRSDIYSLGCMLYECLTGTTPPSAPTPSGSKSGRPAKSAGPLRQQRPDVPPALEGAIERALSYNPSDRFATASEFLEAAASPGRPRLRVQWPWIVVAAGVGLAIFLEARDRRPPVRSDPNLIAIWPFRVSTADPAHAYLREGMVDLIATQLSAGGGLRAVNPGSVLSASARASTPAGIQPEESELRKLTAALGAGRYISGSIVGTASQLVITASVAASRNTGASAQVFSVAGGADTLPGLVQALIARLLANEVRQSGEDASPLVGVPLAVLRPFLEGKAAYRHGHEDLAIERFSTALGVDSTFAPAALQIVFLIRGLGGDRAFGDELRLAMTYKHRLAPDDRSLVQALAGPHYPARSGGMGEDLAAWERATELFPNRAEIWYNLGLELHDWGALLGIERWDERAGAALARALVSDSTFAAVFRPSIELAAARHDTAAVRQLWQRLLRTDSTVDDLPYLRWRIAAMEGDSLALGRARRALDSASVRVLRRVYGRVVHDGLPPAEAESACKALERRAQTSSERTIVGYCFNWLTMNEGRRLESDRAYELQRSQAVPNDSLLVPLMLHDEIAAVIAGEADPKRGGRAATELAQVLARPYPSNWGYNSRLVAACGIANWLLWKGDTLTATRTVARVTEHDELTDGGFCRALFRATVAVGRGDTNATHLLARADSIARAGTSLLELWEGNLRIARLWEAQGNRSRALAAIRRRSNSEAWIYLTAPYLREECRLAEELGERAAAIRACQHFLLLRSGADSALSGEIEAARARLTRLQRK